MSYEMIMHKFKFHAHTNKKFVRWEDGREQK